MNKECEQFIYTEDLPHWGEDTIYAGKIKWSDSIGYKVRFNYNGIKGFVRIIDYNTVNREICIEYNNKRYMMKAKHFKDCRLGHMINNVTGDYKIEIGTTFNDFGRNLTIIDRKKEKRIGKNNKVRTDKLYRYRCEKCGYSCDEGYNIKSRKPIFEYWVEESNLIRGKSGCACCSNPAHVVVPHINSLASVMPELIVFFQNGKKEAEKYTKSSEEKVYLICPCCKQIKNQPVMISKLARDKNISCPCSDNFPFPEKVMYFLLDYLKIDFVFQLSKKNYSWCGEYKYDFGFLINDELCIVETHGDQHYNSSHRGRNLEQEKENDRIKKSIAIENGVKPNNYIVIDCRISDYEYIKANILNSRLNDFFNLSDVDWYALSEKTYSNLVKMACDYKKENELYSTSDIGKMMKLDKSTIARYLKIGMKYGWCDYDPQTERERGSQKAGEINKRNLSFRVVVYTEEMIKIDVYESAQELVDQSFEKYGVVFTKSRIQYACRSGKKYKGYYFKYDN